MLEYFQEQRRKCHRIHGYHGEDCLKEELEEKRVQSFQNCPAQAKAYYGAPMADAQSILPKATCSLWAEAFCFGDLYTTMDDAVVQAHIDAQSKVNNSPEMRRECRRIARELADCLRRNRTSTSL